MDEEPDCHTSLRVLADKTRLAIVRRLMESPCHVGEINESLKIEQSLLSHHLRILRESGLVNSQREGKAVLYRLADETRLADSDGEIDLGCCRLSFDDSIENNS